MKSINDDQLGRLPASIDADNWSPTIASMEASVKVLKDERKRVGLFHSFRTTGERRSWRSDTQSNITVLFRIDIEPNPKRAREKLNMPL